MLCGRSTTILGSRPTVRVLEAGVPVAERVLDDSFKNLSKSERKQLFALAEKVLADEAS
jgi:hypothetical protein